MDMTFPLSDEQVVNGISVQFAQMLRDEVQEQPDLASGRWHIESEWTGQTGSIARVKDFQIGGDNLVRHFDIEMDQPHELFGGNGFASPQEHLIAALAGCFIANFSTVCALRGLHLTSLRVGISGSTDMRGLFDVPSEKGAGFQDICFEVFVTGNALEEELTAVFEHVKEISPNLDCFGHATPISAELVVSGR